jgi:hypothetical protein
MKLSIGDIDVKDGQEVNSTEKAYAYDGDERSVELK